MKDALPVRSAVREEPSSTHGDHSNNSLPKDGMKLWREPTKATQEMPLLGVGEHITSKGF